MPRFWIFSRTGEACSDQIKNNSAEKRDENTVKKNDSVKECNEKTSENVSIENSAAEITHEDKLNNLSETSFYYGVSLPSGSSCGENEEKPLIYIDKKDALQAVKKYKGARFKAFNKKEDALSFASQYVEQICVTSKANITFSPPVTELEKNPSIIGEKSSSFRGPRCQELVKLRKAIETGNIDFCKEIVWSNPRYLISSGDTPSVLHEGFRYNALHVAAKFKQPVFCQFIFDTIEDPNFMELLYNDDTEVVRNDRITYITDLYLNMPDKGLCETPLHFAAKFGCLKIVQLLVSHPLCDKKRRNKYGLEPKEIICERCPSSSLSLKQQIEEAFEDRFYIPVLRSEDNSAQPIIGEPYSPDDLKSCPVTKSSSPRDPVISVMAVAGPMSPSRARVFYKKWKSHTPSVFFKDFQHLNQIRLCDTEKGLERLGRDLAQRMDTPWSEYWPTLNAWCDLSTPEGLDILEDHLKKLYNELNTSLICNHLSELYNELSAKVKTKNKLQNINESLLENSSVLSDGGPAFHSTPSNISNHDKDNSSSSGEISELCRSLQRFHLYDSDSYIATSPDMPNMFTSSGDMNMENEIYSNSFDSLNNKNEAVNYDSDAKMDYIENCVNGVSCFKTNEKVHKAEINIQNNIHEIAKDKIKRKICFNDKKYVCKYLKSIQTAKKLPNELANTVSVNTGLKPSKFQVLEIDGIVYSGSECVIKSMLEVFQSMTKSSEAITQSLVFRSLLKEELIPKMKYLLESVRDKKHCHVIHSRLSMMLHEEIKETFTQNELHLLVRCLKMYLESWFSFCSSDDDSEIFRDEQLHKKNHFSDKIKWQHVHCILQHLCELFSSDNLKEVIHKRPCSCSWLNDRNDHVVLENYKNSSLHNNVSNAFAFSKQIIHGGCNGNFDKHACITENIIESSKLSSDSDSSDDNFLTPPSSPSSSSSCSSTSSSDEPVTPTEGLEVYVEGECPSKADADIFRVVEKVEVDPLVHPHVCRWKHLMSTIDSKIVDSWPSPAMKKHRQRQQNNSSTVRSPEDSPFFVRRQHDISFTPTYTKFNNRRFPIPHGKEVTNLYAKFTKCDESNKL